MSYLAVPACAISAETCLGGYRLVRRIGAGGMGEVWLAEHTLLGRRAAIKVLHPAYSSRPDIVARFFNEARAATAIADPGIIQIFDFGHHLDGNAFIVMELLEGESLETRYQRPPALTLSEALRIVRQVASSLGAAHQRGIVHRDIKPDNIFLVHDPEVPGGMRAKLLDFGIAKLVHGAGLRTQTSEIIGTPTFMSPEQCRGAGRVDARSDVYSVGCVLFAILTGAPPFQAEGTGELIVQHLTQPPPRVSSRAPVPPAVDELVARCLEKEPDRRFASGAELAAAIALLGHSQSMVPGAGAGAGDLSVGAPSPAVTTTLSGSSVAVSAVAPPRRHRLAAAAVLATVVVLGGIAALRSPHLSEVPVEPSTAVVQPPPAPPVQDPEPRTPAPPPPSPALEVDRRLEATRAVIRDVLAAFARWSQDHASSPCPTLDALVASPGGREDGWHHEIAVTCAEQPEGQRIGVISAGPDGHLGTSDDIRSWELGADVMSLVAGPRWRPTPLRASPRPPAGHLKPARRPGEAAVRSPAGQNADADASREVGSAAVSPLPPDPCRDANQLPSCR